MMSSIPCKNCLVFPICKSKVNDYLDENKWIVLTSSIFKYVLAPKCSLILDWVGETPIYKENDFNYAIQKLFVNDNQYSNQGGMIKMKYNKVLAYVEKLPNKELDSKQLRRKQQIIERVFKELDILPITKYKNYINHNIPLVSKELFYTLDKYKQLILVKYHNNDEVYVVKSSRILCNPSTISIIISIVLLIMYFIFK